MRLFLSEKREILKDQYDFSKKEYKETRTKVNFRNALIKMQEWYKSIIDGSEYKYSYVATTTRIDNNLFFNKQWVLFLDCDSNENLILAIDYLNKVRKTRYNIVQSSPGRYWVVTDITGSFNTIWSETSLVPGIDKKYLSYSCFYHEFYVRAFPNNFSIYKLAKDRYGAAEANKTTLILDPIIPIFPEKSELINPLVQKWYNNLKNYYENDLMPIYNYIKLLNNLKNIGSSNYILDPTKCLNC